MRFGDAHFLEHGPTGDLEALDEEAEQRVLAIFIGLRE